MRVYLTVNPRLIAGARFQTVRSMASALAAGAELVVVPLDRIDFARRRVHGFRRVTGGRFESIGNLAPACDIWINYSDGFYLDHAALGFASAGAFLQAQHDFYDELLDRGRIARLINTVAAERTTLKLWLAPLQRARLRVIASYRVEPTSRAAMIRRLDGLRARYGALVVKPSWGGAGQGVVRLDSKQEIRAFAGRFGDSVRRTHPFDALCAQPEVAGPEKRLWFVGSKCVDGRIIYRRPLPWDRRGTRSERIERYFFDERTNSPIATQFHRDLELAHEIWRRSRLEIGSVDFIGDQVNELNGCGTTFTQYAGWRCVTDARPHLVKWLRDTVRRL